MENVRQDHETTTAMPASTSKDSGYYPIRVDARGSNMGESLYDIAEKLLGSELQNAQNALERLWALRKETQAQDNAGVVDTLIGHYESKVSALRGREERVRRVSEHSRELLEQRRADDARLNQVRQEIVRCTREIEELEQRKTKLRAEEMTLSSSAQRTLDELVGNEREVVAALRDIIESRQQQKLDETERRRRAVSGPAQPAATASRPAAAPGAASKATPVAERRAAPPASAEAFRLAKSVVKTSSGRVLGEYCYDAGIPKERRHYVYNTKFLLEQLTMGLDMLRKDYDRENHAELVQMLQDVAVRVGKSETLHFEIATYDIVNPGRLQETWKNLRDKKYVEVEAFCDRLRAKLDTLGSNYRRLLKAQLDRLHGRTE
jgi:hypothetical protein